MMPHGITRLERVNSVSLKCIPNENRTKLYSLVVIVYRVALIFALEENM
jgi:hypothetical protein